MDIFSTHIHHLMSVTLSDLFSSLKKKLTRLYPENEAVSISYLVIEHFCRYSKTDLVLKKEERIENESSEKVFSALKRLMTNEPVQYVLEETSFYGYRFKVTPDVLIPRPETEELVEWILKQSFHSREINIIDIGTGSGCIAVSLKKSLPSSDMFATDISEKALNIAKENASNNNASIDFFRDDIFSTKLKNLRINFDIIVSNPPYVLLSEKDTMLSNVSSFEPHSALFVDDADPLLFYRHIASFAMETLKTNGWLFFEFNESMGEKMRQLLESLRFDSIEIRKDINGTDRMVKAQKK